MDIAAATDVDALWRALVAAKAEGDVELVRRLENRMRELGELRRFAHLSDAALDQRIAALAGNREAADVLVNDPGANMESSPGDAMHLMAFNEAIRANQGGGDREQLLAALRDERARRRG